MSGVQKAVEVVDLVVDEAGEAQDRLRHAVTGIADHIRAHPDSARAIHEQALRLMSDERDARALTEDIEGGGYYR